MESNPIEDGEPAQNVLVFSPDMLVFALNTIHDTFGYSWREIAKMSVFQGISMSRLWSVANGKQSPRKMFDELVKARGIPAVPLWRMNKTALHNALKYRYEIKIGE